MTLMDMVFNMHDQESKGFLTKEEIIYLSESLLFLTRFEETYKYLDSISTLMQRALTSTEDHDINGIKKSRYRELILEQIAFVEYFETEFQKSFEFKKSVDQVEQTLSKMTITKDIMEYVGSWQIPGRKRAVTKSAVSGEVVPNDMKHNLKSDTIAEVITKVEVPAGKNDAFDDDDDDLLLKEGKNLNAFYNIKLMSC